MFVAMLAARSVVSKLRHTFSGGVTDFYILSPRMELVRSRTSEESCWDFNNGYIHMQNDLNTHTSCLGQVTNNINRYIKAADGKTQEEILTMQTDGEVCTS